MAKLVQQCRPRTKTEIISETNSLSLICLCSIEANPHNGTTFSIFPFWSSTVALVSWSWMCHLNLSLFLLKRKADLKEKINKKLLRGK